MLTGRMERAIKYISLREIANDRPAAGPVMDAVRTSLLGFFMSLVLFGKSVLHKQCRRSKTSRSRPAGSGNAME